MKNTISPVIGFRVGEDDADFLEAFTKRVNALGCSSSELARVATMLGMEAATREITQRKKERAAKKAKWLGMVRGGGFEPPTPTVSR